MVYLLIGAGTALLTAGVLAFFHWAARDGQFRNVERGALTIFHGKELPGVRTDCFPGEPLPPSRDDLTEG